MIGVDGAFDIETAKWDRFVVGGLQCWGHYVEHWDPDDFYDELIALSDHPVTLWGWNNGRFDNLWVLQQARERGHRWEVSCAGSRITRMKHGKLEIRDACAIVATFSLRDACNLIGVDGDEAKATGLPCVCGDDCGGYCSITLRMPKTHRERLSAYLRRDVTNTERIIEAVLTEFDRCGYETRGTVGASAWATAKKLCGLENAAWDPTDFDTVRAGYYGGRVEVIRAHAQTGHRHDMRSAYPAALRDTALPVGEPMTVDGKAAGRHFRKGSEGVYRCRVRVPEMLIPPLPYRYRERITYPTGAFSGTWTRIELQAALDAGAMIERFDLAVVYPDAYPIIRPFVELCWSHRERYPSGGWRKLHKVVPNSFSGKCAERPDREAVIVSATPAEILECPADHECGQSRPHPPYYACCDHGCSKECGSWRALDNDGTIWAIPFYRIGSSAHVQWAAYLTAATRIKLRAKLIEAGDDALYCDTDSVYSRRKLRTVVADHLGTWQYEGSLKEWLALAPKMYRYRDESGDWHVRAKGIPGCTESDLSDFEQGRPLRHERGVMGLKSAAAAGGSLFRRQSLTRTRKADPALCGARLRVGTLTRPLDAASLGEYL